MKEERWLYKQGIDFATFVSWESPREVLKGKKSRIGGQPV